MTKIEFLEEERAKALDGFVNRAKLPVGVLDRVRTAVKKEHNLGDEFQTSDLQTKLWNPSLNLNYWRDTVSTEFNRLWTNAMENPPEAGGQKKGKAAKTHDEKQDAHDDGEHNDSDDSDEDGDEIARTEYRVYTSTLRNLMRPDLLHHYDDMVNIAERRQQEITDTVDEVSVLGRKVVMAVSGR
ncbi:MAG TPA: hypothetical protein VLN58_13560 [Verrucomicrobiae bacterium]|nr:hypothetical protein [Verrucomicrobiae bacterium]